MIESEILFDIKLKVINHLGTFVSEVMKVTKVQYNELVEMSKVFWITENSFNIWTENGGAVIFPPEIISKSILVIEIYDRKNNKY